ncbi:hypothetical protein Egran_02380 [Elaphomyces granulatus]|uniref:Uncharacterized protein n=1 Tax=Elaphomyces granulatus TaxID=519963 RepID=A0A232M0M9_9EURO|nr:hypothetical protein Egran_02380 [Elaphomyces granulatus]
MEISLQHPLSPISQPPVKFSKDHNLSMVTEELGLGEFETIFPESGCYTDAGDIAYKLSLANDDKEEEGEEDEDEDEEETGAGAVEKEEA